MSLKKGIDFIFSPSGALIGGKVGAALVSASMIVGGIVTGQPALIGMGVGRMASEFKKKPKVSPATLDRLNLDIVADAPRKGAVGRTALNTDGRYGAYTGASQEYWEALVATASHENEAHEELWFDTELAWTSAGGAQGRFVGYLTVASRLVGTAANGIAIDSVWTSACTLTGCAYLHLKFKLTGNSKKAESPFASGIPSRITIRGKGAKVPDPRLSTGAGGSGSQSMSDQSTWAYTTAADSGRNPACQVLFYLLGYRIGGKLAIGRGIPPARIDFASFIVAANICDESVARAGGGTRPRYRSDGVFSEADDPDTVLTGLLQAMNAELTDESGKIAVRIDHDDLATPVLALTEDDIIDGDDWGLSDSLSDVNIVKGQYPDPGDGALYQMRDYPQVVLPGADYGSPDGIQRIEPFPLPFVQDPAQAQFLATLRLQRYQYPGRYSARFKKKAWAASYARVVTLTHASTGFSAKKWRVARQVLRRDGSVDLVLREVASAMYAAPTEASVAAAAAPTPFNPLNDPLVRNPVTYRQETDPRLTFTIWDDDRWVNTGVTPNIEKVSAAAAWQNVANLVTQGIDIGVANNAGTTLNLYDAGTGFYTIKGNYVTKEAGHSGWLSNVYSREIMVGNAAVGGRLDSTDTFIGLSKDGETTSTNAFLTIDYTVLRSSDGNWYIYENGSNIGSLGSGFTASTQWFVAYDSVNVRYWADGVLQRSVAASAGLAFRAAVSINVSGTSVSNLQFGTFTDNDFASTGGPTRPENNADVTSEVVGQADIFIACDYNGVPKTGELTKTLAYRLLRLGAEVTSGNAWTRTLLSGNATTSIGGSGTAAFDITGPNNATFADESVVRITATPSTGQPRYIDVTIRRQKDPPPTGSTGGSGNPGTTVNTSTIAGISSTSHAVIAGPIRVKAGTAGQVRCTFPASFKRTSSSAGVTGEYAKVQWSTVGGVMADIAAETASSSSAETVVVGGEPTLQRGGSISVDVTKTGLTSGTDYDVQLLGRKNDVSGTASNTYTNSGTFTAAGS